MPGLDEDSLSNISAGVIGRDLLFFDEVNSTNEIAKERAEKGCREGLMVVASKQIAGRGRMDRTFSSPMGGLYISVVLRPGLPLSLGSILPLLAGLSVSKAISTTVLRETSLKWPNDVLMDGRKVSGILVESGVKGDALEYVVIGIGINVNSTVDELPEEIRSFAGTLKDLSGKEVDMMDLLKNLVCFLDMLYTRLKNGEVEVILDKWSERSSTIGKMVRVHGPGEIIEGKALGVDQSGALLVSVDGSFQRIDIGDIEYLEE
jgi:BirA family biotin operon repressor/biotin-[acetyl-CoA-carboxylase] ligase